MKLTSCWLVVYKVAKPVMPLCNFMGNVTLFTNVIFLFTFSFNHNLKTIAETALSCFLHKPLPTTNQKLLLIFSPFFSLLFL